MNRIIPLILAVALFMENMDSTVIATSLPAIAQDLGVSPIALKLALTSYLVALAIFIPISSWMADRFGAKRIFRIAIGVFMVGSLLCAFSGSLGGFVLARFVQGVGGAMMTPVARLVLVRTTERSELVSAMALLTIPALVGPITGPPIGGFITTYLTWHWIFLINIPIGIAGIILSGIYLPELEMPAPPPIDFIGFVLSALATTGIVFGLSTISLPALPPMVGFVIVAIGIVASVAYVFHARSHPNPLLDLKMFSNTTFRTAVLGGTLFRVATGAIPFLMPLMLQIGFGLTPFQSGSITFIGAIGALTTKFVAKRIFRAAGFRTVLSGAILVASVMTLANGFFFPGTPYVLILGALLIAGFARSFFFTGTNALTFADIDDSQASQATAIAAVMQQVSLALGVAVAGSILEASIAIKGTPLSIADFHLAFFVISLLSASALVPYLRLPRDAGRAVSGHGLAIHAAPRSR